MAKVRGDFPILSRSVHGKPLVYLDNAASAQKPQRRDRGRAPRLRRVLRQRPPRRARALDARDRRVRGRPGQGPALPGRGFGQARSSSCAARPRRSTSSRTSYGRKHVEAGDEILITGLEHHSNIVPWQMLCEEKGARLRVAPINDAGEVPLEALETAALAAHQARLRRPRLERARHGHAGEADRRAGARAGASRSSSTARRSAPRMPVDVQDLDCDFYAFSGPQDVRAHGHRRALRQGRAARGDAAVPGRRRHDPVGHLREDHLQRAPLQVRGRHAEHRGRDRARRGARLPDAISASTGSPPTSTRCSPTAPSSSASCRA